MEDEILDYNWVISREVPIKKEQATLFQEYFNEDSLILAAAMLHDNNIQYHIEVDNPESKSFGNLLHELHIDENELERANKLLGLLMNKDQRYPIKKYLHYPLESLELLLEENENIYINTLVKMELKRRGVKLDSPEKDDTESGVKLALYISVILIIFLVYQFIKELASF